MKKEIENLIRKYVRINVRKQPKAFLDTYIDILLTGQALALGYWKHRTKTEIKRDKHGVVTEADYVEWVISELTILKSIH